MLEKRKGGAWEKMIFGVEISYWQLSIYISGKTYSVCGEKRIRR
jgi:hypothetical protein